MQHKELHDGRSDGLRPLVSLDLDRVKSFSDLLDAMSDTAFSGRSAGEAARILTGMFRDQACGVVMTISGAMTVAKQGKIICDLIDRGCVQAIVATGALIAHGLTESIGLTHYRADPNQSDEELFEKGYNRIYDTLEMEANLNDLSTMVEDVLREEQPDGGVWSSYTFCKAIGKRLSERDLGTGILRSAYEKDVPVFIPAFTDSELGLDFSTWAISATLSSMSDQQRADVSLADALKNAPQFNPFLDLFEYAQRVKRHDTLGIFTIGGGVPRNWAQSSTSPMTAAEHRINRHVFATAFASARNRFTGAACQAARIPRASAGENSSARPMVDSLRRSIPTRLSFCRC